MSEHVDQAALPGARGRKLRRGVAYALLIAYAIITCVPFGWTIITSFKTLPDSTQLTLVPDPFTLEAWDFALNHLQPSVVVLFLNSAVIAAIITLTNVLLGATAGYAFARLRFPGRDLLFLAVLATLMIPDQLRLVPVYILFSGIGLTAGFGQYVAVVLVGIVSAASIFLLRQYFMTIPIDLEEAARIDGAGFITTFWRVILPLAMPAIAAVAILSFQGSWNGLFWPAVFLSSDQSHWTLPLGLTQFRLAGGLATNWPPLMATVVIATVPIIVLYVFFQRYFVEGVAASGVKG